MVQYSGVYVTSGVAPLSEYHWECLTATDFLSVDEFRNFLVREGIHLIRLPPRSPNLNAFAERFVRSIKSECLNRMILFVQDSLQHAITHFMAHYHTERNQQGRGNRLLQPGPIIAPSQPVHRRRRLVVLVAILALSVMPLGEVVDIHLSGRNGVLIILRTEELRAMQDGSAFVGATIRVNAAVGDEFHA